MEIVAALPLESSRFKEMVSVAEAVVVEEEEGEVEEVCFVWAYHHKPLSQIALLLVIMYNVYLVHMLVHQLLLALTSTPGQCAFRVVFLCASITSGDADIVLTLSVT